jgi:uncharacterized protein (DUF433 family)
VHSRASHHSLGRPELAGGRYTEEQILADYPELNDDDFRAVYEYAARVGKRVAR